MTNEQTRDAFEAWCKGFCTGLLLNDDAKWAKLAALDAWQAATEQGKRQPLTDEQIEKCVEQVWGSFADFDEVRLFTRSIEAAHGITPSRGKP